MQENIATNVELSSPCHNSEPVGGSLNPLQVDAYLDLWAQFLQVDDSFTKATFAASSNDPAARRALSELRRGMKVNFFIECALLT